MYFWHSVVLPETSISKKKKKCEMWNHLTQMPWNISISLYLRWAQIAQIWRLSQNISWPSELQRVKASTVKCIRKLSKGSFHSCQNLIAQAYCERMHLSNPFRILYPGKVNAWLIYFSASTNWCLYSYIFEMCHSMAELLGCNNKRSFFFFTVVAWLNHEIGHFNYRLWTVFHLLPWSFPTVFMS